VKSLDVGYRDRQVSCMFSFCFRSRSALVAFSLSGLAGARSSASSVRLKSPNIKSGCGKSFSSQVFEIESQKFGCFVRSFGA